MVTVAILGVLALGAVPLAELVVQRGKEQELRSALRQIRGAIDAYKQASDEGRITRAADASGYPPNLEVLVDGVVDAKDPARRRIFFLRRLPREPIAGRADVPAAATWALRSHDSPADAPQPGKDVFDVACRCEGTGLNGLPYREW
jgi:general secretion pathway protein G